MLLRTVNSVTNVISSFTFPLRRLLPAQCGATHLRLLPCSFFHNTPVRQDLKEFFEDEELWDKYQVTVGRPWRKDDLRLKSNSDLHKLWYVLLKEKNMLLTMDAVYTDNDRIPKPYPERIYKVKESMTNLEEVVRERNRAYYELETGTSGERPTVLMTTPIGLKMHRKMEEFHIPKWMNGKFQEENPGSYRGRAVKRFLSLLREKKLNEKRRREYSDKLYVAGLIRNFPNIDMDLLQEQYPHVNVAKVKEWKHARGHYVPE